MDQERKSYFGRLPAATIDQRKRQEKHSHDINTAQAPRPGTQCEKEEQKSFTSVPRACPDIQLNTTVGKSQERSEEPTKIAEKLQKTGVVTLALRAGNSKLANNELSKEAPGVAHSLEGQGDSPPGSSHRNPNEGNKQGKEVANRSKKILEEQEKFKEDISSNYKQEMSKEIADQRKNSAGNKNTARTWGSLAQNKESQQSARKTASDRLRENKIQWRKMKVRIFQSSSRTYR